MQASAADSVFTLTIKRNCSISPIALLRILAGLAAVTLVIAAAFAWFAGAWPILPFAGIEIAALAAAFYVNGRHAGDYERIALASGRLRIEVESAGKRVCHEFDAAWVRLTERKLGAEHRLVLRSYGREIEIGRHLDGERRKQLAAQLRCSLPRTGER